MVWWCFFLFLVSSYCLLGDEVPHTQTNYEKDKKIIIIRLMPSKQKQISKNEKCKPKQAGYFSSDATFNFNNSNQYKKTGNYRCEKTV